MVVAVVFTVTFNTEESAQAFLSGFRKLQRYVLANEPGALLYELHRCYHEGALVPLKYVVLERYHSRFDLDEVHRRSGPFTAFVELLRGLDVAAQSVETFETAQRGDDEAAAEGENAPGAERTHPLLRKGVLVFGGARVGRRAGYTAAAAQLGERLARREGRALVYGGGTAGVMGAVARATKAAGGVVITVIPRPLCAVEALDEVIGDLVYYTETMSERKSIMFACADVVVALPGGIGTFDELLEVLTLFQLDAYRPKIGLLNVDGFYEPFMTLLRHLVAEGFLPEDVFSTFVMASTADDLMDALNRLELPPLSENKLVWSTRP
ncbi:unnamed protein product [Phytomonas sp. EM1]|nr:unnamed protein product [Phytomonas sp. EM1]|eukprot:CCW63932.1 unnamed protein product [Phytomonas sp. isolate EM1]